MYKIIIPGTFQGQNFRTELAWCVARGSEMQMHTIGRGKISKTWGHLEYIEEMGAWARWECHLCNLLASDLGYTVPVASSVKWPKYWNEMQVPPPHPTPVLRIKPQDWDSPQPLGKCPSASHLFFFSFASHLLAVFYSFLSQGLKHGWLPEMVILGQFRKAFGGDRKAGSFRSNS